MSEQQVKMVGPVTLALATAVDHPIPGQVVVGIVKGPYDDAHERRAVVYDNKGNGIVFYKLGR